MSVSIELPFADSRRLIGANLFFPSTGAVLEAAADVMDDSMLAGWRRRVVEAHTRFGWQPAPIVARVHELGTSLAFAAPCDQLFVATEINEWALCATLLEHDPTRWRELEAALRQAALESGPDPEPTSSSSATVSQTTPPAEGAMLPVLEQRAAFARFEKLAAVERRPLLQPLLDAAAARELQFVLDETTLTVGSGSGGLDFPVDSLPTGDDVAWEKLHNVPTALVTGSNGKTTTVRLLAACARAQGWSSAYSSTDGVFFDGELISAGDYSGPAGGRMALRERRAQAVVLETARGGILRRGVAVSRAEVALVTNVSADHFGEYGVDDLAALADVKLTIGAVVPASGLFVLNADDPVLREKAAHLAGRFGRCPRLGWFALNADAAWLRDHRSLGGATCGVRDGRMRLSHGGAEYDLGSIASMPLTVDGSATYNIANLAGAALAAVALGVEPATIASVFGRFGANPDDNLGRLMRFDLRGVRVVLDYAHNADGLRGLLRVAQHLRGGVGRLGLLLGHAGNRRDADIEELARIAAEFHPDLVVVKENESHLRGREQGEVPRIIRNALLRAGLPESALPVRMTEVDAARCALEWAQPGDVLALLVHSAAARSEVLSMLGARVRG